MSFRFQGELEIWDSWQETKHLFFCSMIHTDPMGGRRALQPPQTLEVLTWTFVHTLTPHRQKFRERPNVLRLSSGPGTFTEKNNTVTRNVFFFPFVWDPFWVNLNYLFPLQWEAPVISCLGRSCPSHCREEPWGADSVHSQQQSSQKEHTGQFVFS